MIEGAMAGSWARQSALYMPPFSYATIRRIERRSLVTTLRASV